MTRRRALIAGLALALATGGVCALVVARSTEFERRDLAYYGEAGDPPTPAWTRPCRRLNRRYQRRYVLPCGRVDALVLYRQVKDPDGGAEAHLVVAAGTRLVIVKTDPGRGVPGPGHRVRRAGLLARGRFGLPVVDARARLARRAP